MLCAMHHIRCNRLQSIVQNKTPTHKFTHSLALHRNMHESSINYFHISTMTPSKRQQHCRRHSFPPTESPPHQTISITPHTNRVGGVACQRATTRALMPFNHHTPCAAQPPPPHHRCDEQ